MGIYKSFIKTYGLTIGICILLGMATGIMITRMLPVSYDVSLSLAIDRQDEISDQFYAYDGYYAIQAEDEFSKTVAMWFTSPDFVQQVFTQVSKEDLDSFGIKDFRNMFSAEQISANQVEVLFSVTDPETGKDLTVAIDDVINERLQQQKRQEYIIYLSDPVIKQTQYIIAFWAIGGGILAGVVAFVGSVLKEYWQ